MGALVRSILFAVSCFTRRLLPACEPGIGSGDREAVRLCGLGLTLLPAVPTDEAAASAPLLTLGGCLVVFVADGGGAGLRGAERPKASDAPRRAALLLEVFIEAEVSTLAIEEALDGLDDCAVGPGDMCACDCQHHRM